ncbi:MAG TPA: cation diffusion facilitator family transporter [Solirubrobacteraceae bacterium]|jgi:cation diffusion facilitator family transporter
MARAGSSEQAAEQRRTTLASIAAASLLVALKLGVGLAAGSLALISAGIESSGDVLAATLTFFAVRLGRQPADPEHPYGHGRAENLGALGEAGILIAGGVIVAVEAIRDLIAPHGVPETRWFVFVVIAIALAVDLTRTVVSLRTARRYNSPALRSNALHFAGDMAGSAAVLIGLLIVRAGFAQADAIAALVIAAIILAAAARLIAENANVLMDRTPEDAREAAERALAHLEPDIELVRLRLRESAGRYFADVVAAVPPGQAVIEGHQAADLVEKAIHGALPGSDVVVHVEPRRSGLDLRDHVLEVALSEPLVREVHDITIYQQGDKASVSLHLKFPDDLELTQALEVAANVERAIAARPGVDEVQTHLEPLERPLQARTADSDRELEEVREVERIVLENTGSMPRQAKLLCTDTGRVIFLTLDVNATTSLVDAHQLASELEDELRKALQDIGDVVVHTSARI